MTSHPLETEGQCNDGNSTKPGSVRDSCSEPNFVIHDFSRSHILQYPPESLSSFICTRIWESARLAEV